MTIGAATNPSASSIPAGPATIAQLKGITREQLQAGILAGRTLMERGEHEAAADVLGCLALYDPYQPEVWSTLEELFRRERRVRQANLFADLARAMAA